MKDLSNPAQLSDEKTADLIKQLNHILADLQIHYQNLRGLHWNIKGQLFFSLHEKFEEYYTESAEIIDELAERILTLGGTPLHSFEDYLSEATIKAKKNVSDGNEALAIIAENNKVLLHGYREALKTSGEINDEGTTSMMSDLISATEKRLWMLQAAMG